MNPKGELNFQNRGNNRPIRHKMYYYIQLVRENGWRISPINRNSIISNRIAKCLSLSK
jgi:hypothetical protein